MSDLIRDTLNEYTEDQNHRAYKDRLRNGEPSPQERERIENEDRWNDDDRQYERQSLARHYGCPFTPSDDLELSDWLDSRL